MAGQVGLDMAINDRWFVNASAWLIDIDTDAHTAVGTINTSIDPVASRPASVTASDDKRGRCTAMTTSMSLWPGSFASFACHVTPTVIWPAIALRTAIPLHPLPITPAFTPFPTSEDASMGLSIVQRIIAGFVLMLLLLVLLGFISILKIRDQRGLSQVSDRHPW
jgi:hypothetical protein